jgi:hypothetical protein
MKTLRVMIGSAEAGEIVIVRAGGMLKAMVSLSTSLLAELIAWRSVQLPGVALQLPPVSAVLVTVKVAAAALLPNSPSTIAHCLRIGCGRRIPRCLSQGLDLPGSVQKTTVHAMRRRLR